MAIIRAALAFWDDEMASADRTTYMHYLHSTDQQITFDDQDIAEVRQFFNEVKLKVALINEATGNFDSTKPVDFASPLVRLEHGQILVVVIVPETRD